MPRFAWHTASRVGAMLPDAVGATLAALRAVSVQCSLTLLVQYHRASRDGRCSALRV